MPTYYALPALVAFDTTNGWSLSSGGAGAGTSKPGVTDTAIIDINSGPPRSIGFNGGQFGVLQATADAAKMTLTGLFAPQGSGTQSLANLASIGTLYINATVTVNGAGTPITGGIQIENGAALTLSGDITAAGGVVLASSAVLNLNSYTLNVDHFVTAASTAYTLGTGTLDLRGPNPWQTASTTFPGTAYTIKISDKSASVKSIPSGKTFANFWNDTGVPGTPTAGGIDFGGMTVTGNYRASPGTVTILSSDVSAGSFTLDGAGVLCTVRASTASIQKAITKTGGGAVDINYCSVKDIAFSGATWRALNSVNGGNVSGITFVPNNSRFLAFF